MLRPRAASGQVGLALAYTRSPPLPLLRPFSLGRGRDSAGLRWNKCRMSCGAFLYRRLVKSRGWFGGYSKRRRREEEQASVLPSSGSPANWRTGGLAASPRLHRQPPPSPPLGMVKKGGAGATPPSPRTMQGRGNMVPGIS